MKAYCKVAGMTCALLVLGFGLLWSTGSVNAAAEGKITGHGETGWRGPAHEGH